jgi:electron transport complex, RnfABCDGE type, G subunit
MMLVLTGISIVVATTLALMYAITKEPINKSKTIKQQNAIKEILPPFEHVGEPEFIEVNGSTLSIYKAFDSNDDFVGAAVESFSKNGFSGDIRIMVGFDKEGNIVDYSVLEQKETPGLGTKIVDWFKPVVKQEKSLLEKLWGIEVVPVERNNSIIGKNPGNNKLTVSQDGGEIDAITASTISSRAFLEAVQDAYELYLTLK